MNIYVGNLSYEITEDELRQAFAANGEVGAVNVVTDRYTGRPRGFAFVEMPQDEQARQAIQKLNGTALKGRNITVNEARPRESRPPRRDGGGGGGGGRGRGGDRW